MSKLRSLFPALTLAAGILASTALASGTAPTFARSVTGAALLCASVLLAGAVDQRIRRGVWRLPKTSLILAPALMVALLMAGASDPSRVVELLPILGACAIPALGDGACCAPARSTGA